MNAPAFCHESTDSIITWHPLEIVSAKAGKGEYRVKAKFKKFWRCGFYDWKLMEILPEGRIAMLKKYDSEGVETFAQGRFIVHPEGVTEQQIHEVMVDYKEQDSDPDKNFFALAEDIPNYVKEGINCLYLMGILERDNGIVADERAGIELEVKRPNASPLAITDLSVPSRMLGGDTGYSLVSRAAHQANIRILIDCMARVSSTRPHHKYRKLLLHTLDDKDRYALCYGTDGRAVDYEDTAILNYRKLSSWNMIINDTLKVAEKYKVNGIHLDNAQTWPVVLELDEEELYRKDPDGTPAYTDKQILDGEIVKQCEGQGYWDSDSLIKYPSPIFIKLCKEFWAKFPDFLIIGECLGGSSLENRQGILARSGIIPRLFKLPIALAAIFGKKLHRSGQVIGCKPETVNTIKNWYESNRKFTPEGSYLVQSSISHIWPYPGLLYGRGAWSAVDVLFFMPDIPMTFMGEIKGDVYRKTVTSIYQAKPLPRSYIGRPKSQLHLAMEEQEESPQEKKELPEIKKEEKKLTRVRSMISLSSLSSSAETKKKEDDRLGVQFGFDLKKINLHYQHRRKLRSDKPVLRFGQMIMLDAKHSEGTHPYILAFARFSLSETAVIAINFTDRNVSFYIDLRNLLPTMQKHYPPNVVVLYSDWLTDGDKEYYFLNELIHEKMPMTLKPFSSLCRGIVICNNDAYAYAVALEKSAIRLNNKVIRGQDCSSAQLCQQLGDTLATYGSLNDFAMRLTAIVKLYADPNKLDIHKILLNDFGSSDETKNAGLCMEYCKRIVEYKGQNGKIVDSTAYKASKEIIKDNKLGPIVFVTPEIGRWSTVGGLGVMVDELTQGLAAINEDVYLIAVYYDKNRKGEGDYLSKDPAGFKYVKNIEVKTDEANHTLGVHVGVVNKVKLVFLHNAGLFPSPYPDWNAAMTLRQIVVFCKVFFVDKG
jgi:starch synthase